MKQKKIMLLYKYYYDVYMLWRQMDKSNFTGMFLITFFAYTRFHPKSKLIIPLKYVTFTAPCDAEWWGLLLEEES